MDVVVKSYWNVSDQDLLFDLATLLHGHEEGVDLRALIAELDAEISWVLKQQWLMEAADSRVDLPTDDDDKSVFSDRATSGCIYAAAKRVMVHVLRRTRAFYWKRERCDGCR
jgi:hypothetical protein